MNTAFPKRLLSFALLSLLMHGCSTPTEQEWATFCQNDEWTQHGYFDATNGLPFKIVRGYQERCGDDFSKQELANYQRGFIRGLREFCTQEKGFELGKKGKANPETCPPELQKPFLAGYKQGIAERTSDEALVQRKIIEREMESVFERPPSIRDTWED